MIFKSQMTLSHLWPMNKKLECESHQIYSKMLRKISKKETWSQFNHQEFIFWSTFCTYVLRTFLKIICWQFLVPRSERFFVNWFELNWVFFSGFSHRNIFTLVSILLVPCFYIIVSSGLHWKNVEKVFPLIFVYTSKRSNFICPFLEAAFFNFAEIEGKSILLAVVFECWEAFIFYHLLFFSKSNKNPHQFFIAHKAWQ